MHVSLDSALGRQRRLNSVGESVLQIAPSAAAAYSLRSLTGGDPKVVRVRRASDNHEQDFTASGVSSGALTSFVNAQVVAPLDIQELSGTGRDGDFIIAKAAYSLRSLGTRQATVAATGDTVARADGKFVAQVRRSSDDALKSFTATEVTDGTLLAFTNENIQLFSNDFETNTDGFTLNTGGSNTAVRNTSDGFSGSGCLQLNLTSSSNSISTVKTDTYMQDTDGVSYTVSFYAKAVSGSTNLVVKIGTESSSAQQISFSENGGEWVKYSLTFVNNFGAGAGNRNQRIAFAGSTSDTTEWRIDDFQIVQTTSNGFVKTWYDQSVTNQAGDTATGNHAVQATAASQPKIVDAGSLITGGLDFDGTAHQLALSNTLGITSVASHFVVTNATGGGADTLFDNRDSGVDGYRIATSSATKMNFDWLSSDTEIDRTSGEGLYYINKTSSQAQVGTNGGTPVTTSESGSVSVSTAPKIGARSFSSALNFYEGTINEFIIYGSDQTDNRTAIEANIGEAYSIDLPSGVDPGFDQVDGFVETWYDQSGNGNDATQATAGSQPKIVNAGALLTDGILFGANINLSLSGSGLDIFKNVAHGNIFTAIKPLVTGTSGDRYFSAAKNTGTSARFLFGDSTDTSASFRIGGRALDTDSFGDEQSPTTHGNGVSLLTGFLNYGAATGTLFLNGSQVATNAIPNMTAGNTSDTSSAAADIGDSQSSGALTSDFNAKEIIIYNTDQSDNRVALETNIISHYGIS